MVSDMNSKSSDPSDLSAKADNIRHVLSRFEGVVDEETLGLLALYSLGKIEAKGTVRRIRLRRRENGKVCAYVDVDIRPDGIGMEFNLQLRCTLAFDSLKGEYARKLSLISPGSFVQFSGKFSGEVVRPESFRILKAKVIRVSGIVAGAEGDLFCLAGNRCFCCYSDTTPEVGEFVTVEGALADRDVIVVSDMEVCSDSGDVSDVKIFTPVSELPESGRVCIAGRVSGIGELKRFRNREYASLHISDETGRVRLLLWSNIDVYRKVDIGDGLKVLGGRVEVREEVTVHCDEFTIFAVER